MDEGLEDWFIREILPHEAALTRYIARAWFNPADVTDLRQEIYIKILEAAGKSRPAPARYFLFAVAKHLLTDHVRRNRIVPIDLLQDCDSLNVLIDELSPERRTESFQQLEKLLAAFEQLPDRCREVIWMKKIEGLSQKDIAKRLSIAEGTVETHLVRGMRLLSRYYHGDETDPQAGAGKGNSGHESHHGQ